MACCPIVAGLQRHPRLAGKAGKRSTFMRSPSSAPGSGATPVTPDVGERGVEIDLPQVSQGEGGGLRGRGLLRLAGALQHVGQGVGEGQPPLSVFEPCIANRQGDTGDDFVGVIVWGFRGFHPALLSGRMERANSNS
jgi:hypothetical protein